MFHSFLDRVSRSRERVYPIYSGTMDVIVSEQSDGSLKITQFHVRVGSLTKINKDSAITLQNFRMEGVYVMEQIKFTSILLQINGKDIDQIILLNLDDGLGYFQTLRDKEVWLSKTPSQEIIQSFNLNYGKNLITYLFHAKKNLQEMSAKIYRVNQDTKIIISDVDGTITKSDVMGHVMSMFGKNYSHEDICELYHNLSIRGYLIVYVSSRSLLQYDQTRTYLERQLQLGYKLPDGPILLSDEAIFDAFKTEVIYKSSDTLKSKILKTIRGLFERADSVYAGVGNRENDVIAYRSAEIPFSRIFLINKQSIIFKMDEPQPMTYKHIMQNLDQFFPMMNQ